MSEELLGGRAKLEQALMQLRSALALIDEAGGAPVIGAHLDLAIRKLETAITEARRDSESKH